MKGKHILFVAIFCGVTILALYIFSFNNSSEFKMKQSTGNKKQEIVKRSDETKEQNALHDSNSMNEAKKVSEQTPQENKNDKSFDVVVDDIPLDLPEIHSYSPAFFDVVSYLNKDNSIKNMTNKSNLKFLVRRRYNLSNPTNLELALTDLYELVRLSDSEFYRNHWPKEKLYLFVEAALEEILENSSNNYSALLLKSRVNLEQGNSQEAFSIFKAVCEGGTQNDMTVPYTELVTAACNLLSSDKLTSEEKTLAKELAYKSGLSPESALAQYMEGKPATVSLRFFKTKENPHDIGKTVEFFFDVGRYPREIMEGQDVVPGMSPRQRKLTELDYRRAVLMEEKDVRGLVELSYVNEGNKTSTRNILFTHALAHSFAGRFSASIPLFEELLNMEEMRRWPNAINEIKAHLAWAYYEQGASPKNSEMLDDILDAESLAPVTREFLSRVQYDKKTQ